MKKSIKVFLLIIVVLLSITGCGQGVKTEDGKTVYTCIKRGIEDSSSSSNTSWTKDITNTAKLADDNQLSYYLSSTYYTYKTREDCEHWCDIKVKWNDEINEKKYPGGHRETTCNCSKRELTEKYIYDDIPNLASILRSDIRELNADNTFKLDTWLEKYQSKGYTCQ